MGKMGSLGVNYASPRISFEQSNPRKKRLHSDKISPKNAHIFLLR